MEEYKILKAQLENLNEEQLKTLLFTRLNFKNDGSVEDKVLGCLDTIIGNLLLDIEQQ